MSYCINCGQKLVEGSKFCHMCGAAVKEISPGREGQRKQEYVGKILKCPNCGEQITETTAICSSCGMKLTGMSAVSSVQMFKDQLMAIESSRKKGFGGFLGVYMPADKADMQKLTLIRNFPIPNSVDDCLEFMMLAIANIDVNLSKNTISNRINNNNQIETATSIGRTISNAWVSKMEQVYRKAEMAFPNDPAFRGIQKIYYDKMKELKIKVK